MWLLAYFQGQLVRQVSAVRVYQVLDEGRDLNFQVEKTLKNLQQILD